MILEIPEMILNQIHQHGELAYPEEGAGMLLGQDEALHRRVTAILPLENSREDSARGNRYLITPQDMLRGEQLALQHGLEVLGVFHSHPDHPDIPSGFDREWALPWFSYLITSIQAGKASGSRSWRLEEDRSAFAEERILPVSP